MNPQEELNQLLKRQEALHQELKARKKELLEAHRTRQETLKRQIRRAQSRITAAQRKRRTRRLILIGTVVQRKVEINPKTEDWLKQALKEYLDRPQDRELFDLPPKPDFKPPSNKEISDGNPD